MQNSYSLDVFYKECLRNISPRLQKTKIKKKFNTKRFFQIYNLKVYLDSVCQEINKLILFCRKHYYMYQYALPTI